MMRASVLMFMVLGICLTGCSPEPPSSNGDAKVMVADPDAPAHGFLGIQLVSPGAVPLVIQGFVPNSPAQSSGLQPGDALLRIDRQWDPTGEQLMETLQAFSPGDVLGVRVLRGDEELEYRVRLISAAAVEESMQGTVQ